MSEHLAAVVDDLGVTSRSAGLASPGIQPVMMQQHGARCDPLGEQPGRELGRVL